MPKKVWMINDIADCGESYYKPFERYGERIDGESVTADELALAVFCGGSDVSPYLYDCPEHPQTGPCDPQRDRKERFDFDFCFMNEIPMVGICRGAQFLCVMCGGKLAQHVQGHGYGDHEVHPYKVFEQKTIFTTNSLHHQMQLPPAEAKVLAWTYMHSKSIETYPVMSGKDHVYMQHLLMNHEPEAVFYPEQMCLGIQWHPETMSKDCRATRWMHQQIKDCLHVEPE